MAVLEGLAVLLALLLDDPLPGCDFELRHGSVTLSVEKVVAAQNQPNPGWVFEHLRRRETEERGINPTRVGISSIKSATSSVAVRLKEA